MSAKKVRMSGSMRTIEVDCVYFTKNREQPVSWWADSRRYQTREQPPAHNCWAYYTWNSPKNRYRWKHCCKDRRAYKGHRDYRGRKASSAAFHNHNAKVRYDSISDSDAGYNRHR